MCKTADTGFAHWYCAKAGWEMLIIQPALSQYNECLMQTVLMRWMSKLSLIVYFWQRTSFIQVIKKPICQLTRHYDNKGHRHISITETYKRLFHTCINVAFPIAKTCWMTITLVILSLHSSYSQPPAPTKNIWTGVHSDGMVSPGGAPEQKVSQPVAVTDSAVPPLFHVWFNCLTLSYNDLYLLKFDGLLSFSHIFFSISSLHAKILRISPIRILLSLDNLCL